MPCLPVKVQPRLWNSVGYLNFDNNYEVALFGRNITDEDNLKGAIDFANLTGFVNEPRIIGVEFKKSFF